jgi:hypothetical protein
MKIILQIVLLAYGPFVFAQGAGTAPPDLAAARARYQEALASVKKQYLKELEQLKANAVVENNSELVAAVSKEIEAMGGNDTGSDVDEGEAPTIESLTTRLTNTTWVWFKWETVTFLRDGTAKWSGVDAATFTWSVVDASPPTIEGKSGDGTAYKMVLDANLRAGQVFQAGQPDRVTARVRHP